MASLIRSGGFERFLSKDAPPDFTIIGIKLEKEWVSSEGLSIINIMIMVKVPEIGKELVARIPYCVDMGSWMLEHCTMHTDTPHHLRQRIGQAINEIDPHDRSKYLPSG